MSTSLSVCLIVKNEARNLPRCLASVRPVAGEIVVVDTGSTDDTVAIATAFGARIHHFAWRDDFAAGFNAAIAQATGDWILMIDADEELVIEDAAAWRQALAEPAAVVYTLLRRNVDEDGRPQASVAHIPRCFRNGRGLAFEGRLHALLTPAMARLGYAALPLAAAFIRHHGYTAAALADTDKLRRNRELNEAVVRDNPQDPAAWLHLGGSLWLAKDLPGALVAIQQVQRLGLEGRKLPASLLLPFCLLQAWVYGATSQPEAAMAALAEGLARYPDAPDLHFERGQLLVRQGAAAEAMAAFEACLRANARPGMAATAVMAHVAIARLKATAGDIERAVAHLEAAMQAPACSEGQREALRRQAEQYKRITIKKK